MHHRSSLLLRSLLSCSALGVLAMPVHAAPVGGVVDAGQAVIGGQGSAAVVVNQSSNRVVINWQNFDTAAGESVTFHQPNASSLALNRVLSGSPTQFNGKLNANGNVVIMNGNGVMFGSTATIDVNGLVATTGNIATNEFMQAARPVFNLPGRGDAAIVNNGLITARDAGLVGFVAPQVVNNGIIAARLGKVQLASGDAFTLDLYGDGLVEVKASDAMSKALVHNGGLLSAAGGVVQLTAAQARAGVDSLVNNSGVIEATTYQNKNGVIILSGSGQNAVANNAAQNKQNTKGRSFVANSGLLDASGTQAGQSGGTVKVLGDHVALAGTSVIHTSGDAGGGTVLVGGDYLGRGDTPTALTTNVASGSVILNSALNTGNGGKSIVWSDHTTSFKGTIIGKGGAQSGNGGFAETSGKQNLTASGTVDLTAAKGSKGTYLLDPDTITVYGNVDPTFTSTDGSVNLAQNLKLWLDGSDQSSMFQDTAGTVQVTDGAHVALWKDKSGDGNDAMQYSWQLYNAPSWSVSEGVVFNGLTSYLFSYLTTAQLGNSVTMNILANPYEAKSAAGLLFWRGEATGINQAYPNGGSTWGYHWQSQHSSYSWIGGPTTLLNQSQYISANFTPTSTTLTQNDGVSYVNPEVNNPSTDNSSALLIGFDFGGGGRNFHGSMSDITIYDRALSADENSLLAQYQSAKWGIELQGGGTGSDEATRAMAADGYNVFTSRYLERLSTMADVVLQADHGITLDLKGDTVALSAGRSLSLQTANGDITAVSAGTLQTVGGNIAVTAGGAGAVDLSAVALNATNGTVAIAAGAGISLGAVNASSVSVTSGSGADITLRDVVNASNGGNAVMLQSGRNFINQAGANALVTPNGRALVYSATSSGNVMGGIAGYDKRYNSTTSYTPVMGSSDVFLYSVNPTLNITIANAGKVQGAANPVFSYAITSGLIGGDTDAVLSGSSLATPASGSSPAGSYAITLNAVNPYNYTLNITNGVLNVTAKPATHQPVKTLPSTVTVRTEAPALSPVTSPQQSIASPDSLNEPSLPVTIDGENAIETAAGGALKTAQASCLYRVTGYGTGNISAGCK